MNTSRLIKILAILAVTSLVAGCKLEIVAVQGGDVAWNGGSCSQGSNCIIEITDPTFSNTFTVTPKPGYEFVKWQKAPGFLCGDSTAPCAVTMPADANLAAAVVGTFTRSYIMPVYKDIGINTDGDNIFRDELDEDDDNDGVLDGDDRCPLVGPNLDGFGCAPWSPADVVSVNGRVWYQPDLFQNLSWNDINVVCPAGVCIDGGVLKGRDMTGWTWASVDEVISLFNYFIGSPGVVSGCSYGSCNLYGEVNSGWAPAFFAHGFRAGDDFPGVYKQLVGVTSSRAHFMVITDTVSTSDTVSDWDVSDSYTSPPYGAWFVRPL